MKKILFFVLGVAVVSGLIIDIGRTPLQTLQIVFEKPEMTCVPRLKIALQTLQIVFEKPGVQLASDAEIVDDGLMTLASAQCLVCKTDLKSGLIMNPPPPSADEPEILMEYTEEVENDGVSCRIASPRMALTIIFIDRTPPPPALGDISGEWGVYSDGRQHDVRVSCLSMEARPAKAPAATGELAAKGETDDDPISMLV